MGGTQGSVGHELTQELLGSLLHKKVPRNVKNNSQTPTLKNPNFSEPQQPKGCRASKIPGFLCSLDFWKNFDLRGVFLLNIQLFLSSEFLFPDLGQFRGVWAAEPQREFFQSTLVPLVRAAEGKREKSQPMDFGRA